MENISWKKNTHSMGNRLQLNLKDNGDKGEIHL